MKLKMETISSGNIPYNDKSSVGINCLLEDLKRLMQDTESSDITFIVGREETRISAHRLILKLRCKNFETSGNEICALPGSTVLPGNPHTSVRLPHYHPNIFQQVILYIYTGKVILNDVDIFEVYGVGQDLGLDELCQHCEGHLTATMTVHNACSFLMGALNMEKRASGGGNNTRFVDRIIAYIGENALDCLRSSSFLNLSRDALIRLISSDNLALEEEDVWRGVLCWAKYKAGVAQPTPHWTEEERLRVCQHLHGVINHVRLLLIDSQVFAEEVEPTGAVPMELSLERYRYAALPNKFKENSPNEDKRLQPRVSLKLFSGSQILSNEKTSFQRILNNWYGVGKQLWRLAFRASSHGYSADAFHRHCDGIAPTYTIILGQHGQISGGFSDVPWSKTSFKGRYVASEKAFLFTLVNDQDMPPTKFSVVKKMFAICYHTECGPIFGAGADLFIADNCNQNMDSYSNLPHSYDGENASCNTLMGDYNFTVLDYEVFTPYGK